MKHLLSFLGLVFLEMSVTRGYAIIWAPMTQSSAGRFTGSCTHGYRCCRLVRCYPGNATRMVFGDRRRLRILRERIPWPTFRGFARRQNTQNGRDAEAVARTNTAVANVDAGGGQRVVASQARTDDNDIGLELSVWESIINFKRNVEEVFYGSDNKKGTKWQGWRYMGCLVKSQRSVLLVSVATLILAAACEVAVPHYSSRALNAATFAQNPTEFARSLRGMISFSLLASVFTGLRGASFWLAGTHVVAKVRFDLLSSLLKQDIAFHDANETGALTSRLASDTAKISNVVSFHVNILCRQVIQAIGGMAYLFTLNRQLASIATAGVVFVGIVTATYGRFSRRISAKVQSALAEAGSVAEQSLSLVRVVRAHANEAHERRRYGRKIGESVQLQETQGIAYGLARVAIGWSQAFLVGGVLVLGARMVFAGKMTGQALMTFVFYTNFVTDSSFDVGDQWAKIQEALGAGQKVFQLLERQPVLGRVSAEQAEHMNGDDANGALPGKISHAPPHFLEGISTSVHGDGEANRGRVEFRSVSFGYPTRPGVQILDGLSLVVRSGERIAVVGSSGGGKSTILRLLCRFYEPDEGRISLGDRDLSTYGETEISQKVSWVTQEPQLFPITVRENIAYGLEEGTYEMQDVEEAARAANIHSFVCGLPDGYDTMVGEGGASLSGGQKQRVAIARALIRDPELLLLDEPTSALDVESEKLVQEALDRAGEGRSVILIAHRLATIQRADRVVVMQDGRVVESGKHAELLSRGGVYASLYKKGGEVATL